MKSNLLRSVGRITLAAGINSKSGLISGVSIATLGPCAGHYWITEEGQQLPMVMDTQSLQSIGDAIAAFGSAGVKVKIDHWSGFDGIVGLIANPVIDGNQLRGDLQLLSEHPARDRILQMAEVLPGQFGLSIAFSGDYEPITVPSDAGDISAMAVRCRELYSIDLVDEPAANPKGLFSAGDPRLAARGAPPSAPPPSVDSEWDAMDADSFFAALKKLLKREELSNLEADLTALRTKHTSLETELTAAKAEISNRQTALAANTTALEAANKDLAAAKAELTTATETHKKALAELEASVEKRASDQAARIAASMGLRVPITAPKPGSSTGKDEETLRAELQALMGKTDAASLTKKAELCIKLRDVRGHKGLFEQAKA